MCCNTKVDMTMFYVFWLLLTINAATSAECPDGWLKHGASCYLFSHGREDWPGAYDMCKIMGAQLVEIEDAAENLYLKLQANPRGYYWIGLTDASEENSWVWMTSKTKLTDQFTSWYPGEPSVYDGKEPENCVEFYPNSGQWNDAPCTGVHYYICEKAAETVEIIG